MSNVPGGSWQPDPTGRYQFRWWDGRQWTQHVSTNGVAQVDPAPMPPVAPTVPTPGGPPTQVLPPTIAQPSLGRGAPGAPGAPMPPALPGTPGADPSLIEQRQPNRVVVAVVAVVVLVAALVVVVLLLLRGAGDDDATVDTIAPVTTVAPTTEVATTLPDSTTSVAPTTEVATTAPPTTVAPTTAAPTTAPPTTAPPPTLPPVPGGWAEGSAPNQAYPPCCDGNWVGAPSPAVVDPAAPLPDGVFHTQFLGYDVAAGVLRLNLSRFDLCGALPAGACTEGFAGTDLGVQQPPLREITVPLDDRVRAVIIGQECDADVRQTNGVDLRAMLNAFTASYDAVFFASWVPGTEPFTVIDDVRSTPRNGFEATPAACDDGTLIWRYGDAPVLRVQAPYRNDPPSPVEPASLILPTVMEINSGQITLYFYAGFFS